MKNPLRRLSEKTKQSHSCLSLSLSGEPESEEKAKALKGHALKMHFLDEIESGRRNELETEWAFDRCDVFQCFDVCCCSENFAENIEEDRKLLWQNKANCYLNFRDLFSCNIWLFYIINGDSTTVVICSGLPAVGWTPWSTHRNIHASRLEISGQRKPIFGAHLDFAITSLCDSV